MNGFFYVFFACVILISVIIAIAAMCNGHDDDAAYRDENGRHSYYDRSLIEKDEFHKNNPEVPYSEIRSFKRLFRFKRKSDHKKS